MSLADSGFITPAAALALVLGANLGSALNPLFEGGNRGDPSSRRAAGRQLINRAGRHASLVLPFLTPIAAHGSRWQPDPRRDDGRISTSPSTSRWRSLFIGRCSPLARLLARLCRRRLRPPIPARRAISTQRALDTPSLALANAARETLHMGDIVEAMLRQAR